MADRVTRWVMIIEPRLFRSCGRLPAVLALAGVAAACAERTTGPSHGPAARVVITAEPHGATAGVPLSPAVAVAIQDSAGRTVSDAAATVVLSLAPAGGTSGAHLRGTTSAVVVSGVAAFAMISVDSAGVGYRLTASAPGLVADTSAAFDIAAGPAHQLAFPSLPAAAAVGEPLGAPLRVLVLDSLGNVATSANDSVTLFVVGSGSLAGITARRAVAGTASYADLSFDDPGTPVLAASAPGLDGAVSGPVAVRLAALTVSAGAAHTCVVAPSHAAYCWGSDANGEIGDSNGLTAPSPVGLVRPPTRVKGPRFASALAGDFGSCGLATDGQAYCWGLNQPFTSVPASTVTSWPMVVPGTSGLAGLSFGTHACALAPSGAASCWGQNGNGELGTGTSGGGSATPLPVTGGHVFGSASAGNSATCGVTTAHEAFCWGYDTHGSLGIGSYFAGTPTPTLVLGGLAWRQVSTSGLAACGVTTSGAAYCWGDNDFGTVGNGTTDSSAVPVPVSGGLTFTAVSVGERHACGLTAAGAAWCWGLNNSGQLGDGTTTTSTVPVPVSGGLAFTALAAGAVHTCGVTAGGAVYCWGANESRQLGYSGAAASVPTKVPGF